MENQTPKYESFKIKTTSKGLKIFVGISIGFLILVILLISAGNNSSDKQTAEETTKSAPLTPEQALESGIRAIVKNEGSTRVSYMETKISKGDPDRPKDSKSVIVKINLDFIGSRTTLLWNTGVISANVFQEIYKSSLPVYDASIWYYGEVSDKYGNAKQDTVLTYSMDKSVFQKINWTGFQSGKLCEFLETEFKASPTSGNACNELVKIQ